MNFRRLILFNHYPKGAADIYATPQQTICKLELGVIAYRVFNAITIHIGVTVSCICTFRYLQGNDFVINGQKTIAKRFIGFYLKFDTTVLRRQHIIKAGSLNA